MEKLSKTEIAEWERLLEDEGMGEVSLFDNTGKGQGFRFVSLTQEQPSEQQFAEWAECVNWHNFGEDRIVSYADTAEFAYSSALSQAIADLPPGWPPRSLAYLESLAEEGFRDGLKWSSRHRALVEGMGISRKEAQDIVRRFRAWNRDKIMIG